MTTWCAVSGRVQRWLLTVTFFLLSQVNKDKDDEALNRWKASLLAGVDASGTAPMGTPGGVLIALRFHALQLAATHARSWSRR